MSLLEDEINNYNYMFVKDLNETYEYCQSSMYNTTPIRKCNFKKMLFKCKKSTTIVKNNRFLSTDYDIYFLILWLQYILLVIGSPIICGLSLITNCLTIAVIRNKCKKKDFKNQMYNLIILNASFNISYCLIMILKLGNECIFHYWSIFCSAIYQTDFMQYSKLLLVNFLGNALRTSISLSYL
jgi:hypothetical protein